MYLLKKEKKNREEKEDVPDFQWRKRTIYHVASELDILVNIMIICRTRNNFVATRCAQIDRYKSKYYISNA